MQDEIWEFVDYLERFAKYSALCVIIILGVGLYFAPWPAVIKVFLYCFLTMSFVVVLGTEYSNQPVDWSDYDDYDRG